MPDETRPQLDAPGGGPGIEGIEGPALAGLNDPQARAAGHVKGPLLIFAGAGSGKTRVITYRVANLVAVHRVAPYRILAVTFTNKAAGEMKHRLEGLVGPELTKDLWVGTFHATCARLLRRFHDSAGLSRNFVIYDDGDQRALMARVLKELDVDDKRYPPRQVLSRIHKDKQEGRGPEEFVSSGYVDDVVKRCFEAYQRHLDSSNAVDFDDLIVKVMKIAEDPESPAGQDLRRRFRYVLVDEFQDVNMVQYRLVRAFASEHHNLCVVGDDDQSIYRWRGADVRIMRNFRRDFPEAEVVKLEQNYRSSGNVVEAALGVIRPARDREPKDLWTARSGGEPVTVAAVASEHDEAAFVVERLREAETRGVSMRDVAIFYRVHAQSRVLEEALRASRIPYQVIGGQRFFERGEIKDLLSYLRVIDNPRSDVDLLRIINVPARKIGQTTVDRLIAAATERRVPVWQAIETLLEAESLGTAARKSLLVYREMMESFMVEARTALPRDLVQLVIERSGYQDALLKDDSPEAEARLQNLGELVGAIGDYEDEIEAAGETPTLGGYLERVTLVSDADTLADQPKVALMTVHAAKGLEFDTVLLTGMEEEMFPFRGLDPAHADELEEERRLAYVAITRARERLYLTHAARRMIFGKTRYGRPSRFISDVPTRVVRQIVTPAAALEGNGRFIDGESRFQGRGEEWTHPQAGWSRPGGAPSSQRGPASRSYGTDSQRSPRAGWHADALPRTVTPPRPPVTPGERYVERDEEAVPDPDWQLVRGARVLHEKFGRGVVHSVDAGADPIVTVAFSGFGEKRIKARFLRAG